MGMLGVVWLGVVVVGVGVAPVGWGLLWVLLP